MSVVALVGRPNVGKSTLFNRLTRTRDALVADRPGLTRDRQYGIMEVEGKSMLLVDTGGFDMGDSTVLSKQVRQQTLRAADEADLLLWMLDGREGTSAVDLELAQLLRLRQQPVILLVNKTEGVEPALAIVEFHELGFDRILAISAQRGAGLGELREILRDSTAVTSIEQDEPDELDSSGDRAFSIGLIGRPNTGKSTLVNRLLGDERVLTSDQPGTTRDSIRVPLKFKSEQYALVDTAGIRRRARIDDSIEKLSVVKSFQTIRQSDAALCIIDVVEGVTDQDCALLGLIADSGKPLIIAFNKWDLADAGQRRRIKALIDRRLQFVNYAEIHFVSALLGKGTRKLLQSVRKIRHALREPPTAAQITEVLQAALADNPPPMVGGRRI
ncbi:MAG: ribosome biogenesis GTPase Der, partial [Candidatus Eutrophobiaceae bacterium]